MCLYIYLYIFPEPILLNGANQPFEWNAAKEMKIHGLTPSSPPHKLWDYPKDTFNIKGLQINHWTLFNKWNALIDGLFQGWTVWVKEEESLILKTNILKTKESEERMEFSIHQTNITYLRWAPWLVAPPIS